MGFGLVHWLIVLLVLGLPVAAILVIIALMRGRR